MFMKKFYLFLTAFMALFSMTANADEAVIYQDNYTDAATSVARWETSRAGDPIQVISTADGNYIQFGSSTTQYNGTRFSTIWGSSIFEGYTIPAETGYTLKFRFNFAQFGNQSSNAQQRNNEIVVLGASDIDTGATFSSNYWGTAATAFPNYLFKITQCTGTGGVATSTTGTCYFQINNQSDSVNVAAATWYDVTLTVVGQSVAYTIQSIDGNPLANGTYALPDAANNKAVGIALYQARYLGLTQIMNLSVAYETGGDVAQRPQVVLSAVQGNDRVYKVTFSENETLHYILPGTTEEQTLDYFDAEDADGNAGVASLTCTQSGTLECWTTKNDAVSQHVTTTVETGVIKLVDPVLAISSVEEGYGKTYTVTFDNSAVLLTPNVALTYAISYNDGESASGEIANGGTLSLTKQGSLTVTANSIPVNGVEYYDRSSTTVENNVEYSVIKDIQFNKMTDEELAANTALYTSAPLSDKNTSHWPGHWMEANATQAVYDSLRAAGYNINPVSYTISDASTETLKNYTVNTDELATAFSPLDLSVSSARNWSVLVDEGLWSNQTNQTNVPISFDQKYASDDANKPNFVVINRTSGYDRYDHQDSNHLTDVVNVTKTDYTLYRYDTAINRVRVFAYKGFTTGIKGVTVNNEIEANPDAPVYTISGVQVSKTNLPAGIYIQNGKKFVVK